MRHRKGIKKLGRTTSHRRAMSAALVCALIREQRIKTTISKARIAQRLAEKMVTLANGGGLTARRRALSFLGQESIVAKLFSETAPRFQDRPGGYTRVVRMGQRSSDGSEMALLEWVGTEPPPARKRRKKGEDQQAA